DPGARRPGEGVYDLGVDQRVHLGDDAAPPGPGLGLSADQAQQGGPHPFGGDQQALVVDVAAVPGEVVEQVGQGGADGGVGGEPAEVPLRNGGAGVVVPGADVAVAAHAALLLAHHQGRLGVDLQAREPVGDVDPRFLQAAGPGDVRLLVE